MIWSFSILWSSRPIPVSSSSILPHSGALVTASFLTIVDIVKKLAVTNAPEWGRIELEETGIGRLDHKIEKLQIIKLVPGVEWLRPYSQSGDHGITLEEFTPFGVVAAVTPSTHSIPTLSGNII